MADGKSLFNSIVADLDEEIKSSIVNFKGGFFTLSMLTCGKKEGRIWKDIIFGNSRMRFRK